MNIDEKVAEETGYSEEVVRFAIRRFWVTIFFFLRNYEYSKRAIIIPNFIKFYIPEWYFDKENEYKINESFLKCLEQIKENEGQTTRKINNAGDSQQDKEKES